MKKELENQYSTIRQITTVELKIHWQIWNKIVITINLIETILYDNLISNFSWDIVARKTSISQKVIVNL